MQRTITIHKIRRNPNDWAYRAGFSFYYRTSIRGELRLITEVQLEQTMQRLMDNGYNPVIAS